MVGRLGFAVLLVGCWHEPQAEVRSPAPPPAAAPTRTTRAVYPPLPPMSELATSLAQQDMFALGGVGYGGNQSEGERLALAIAGDPDAVDTFAKLIVHPNRVARLYAYWALRTLDPARAAQHQRGLLADTTRVQTGRGCIIGEEATHEVAAYIDQWPQLAMTRP